MRRLRCSRSTALVLGRRRSRRLRGLPQRCGRRGVRSQASSSNTTGPRQVACGRKAVVTRHPCVAHLREHNPGRTPIEMGRTPQPPAAQHVVTARKAGPQPWAAQPTSSGRMLAEMVPRCKQRSRGHDISFPGFWVRRAVTTKARKHAPMSSSALSLSGPCAPR